MELLLITLGGGLAYGVSFYFSPFPYWKTYFVLWRTVLFNKESSITSESRWRQIRFLLNYALLNPLWTFLWYFDDVFYSDYKSCQIKPVFIIGSPRSGTTFLHRTLGADENTFFAMRHIEWRYPFITLQKLFNHSSLANKILNSNYWPNTPEGKVAAKMHPNTLSDWEEDGIFFEECFLHYLYVALRFPYPELMSYLCEFPELPQGVQDKMLNNYKKAVQKVMYLRGDKKIYLSKEVAGHNKIEGLMKLFPDAKFVVITRYASEYLPSLMELIRYSVLTKTGIDPKNIPGYEAEFVERMRKENLLLVHLCNEVVDAEIQVKVTFNQFSNNIVDSVKYIYGALGLTVSEAYLQHLTDLVKLQNKRERGYDYHKNEYSSFEKFDEFVAEVESGLVHY